MKLKYEAPLLELLEITLEMNILSGQIDPGKEYGDDEY